MKLATFARAGVPTLGLVRDEQVIALDRLATSLPTTMEALLDGGASAMSAVRDAAERAGDGESIADYALLAPVRFPRKFLGIGMNYGSHVEELRARGAPIPDLRDPMLFNKQTSCIAGPRDPIHLPAVSEQLDFEGELGIVIGRRCRHVAPEDARKVIAGYLVVNDISVRDWQARAPTATLGKSFDTHGPTGPWLTTVDEIADPEALAIRTTVDGVVMQDGNTRDLIHGIDALIAYITSVMTLEPGDILATGTPGGVASGRTPPPWLRSGQVVRVEIEGLGFIENRIIDEPIAETTTRL